MRRQGRLPYLFLYLGFAILLVINTNYIARSWESNVEIMTYLNDGVTGEAITALQTQIQAIPGVKDVQFISKDEALATLEQQFGQPGQLQESLGGSNPLPDAFKVSTTNPRDVDGIANLLSLMPGIDQVRYGQAVVDKLLELTYWMRLVGLAIVALTRALRCLPDRYYHPPDHVLPTAGDWDHETGGCYRLVRALAIPAGGGYPGRRRGGDSRCRALLLVQHPGCQDHGGAALLAADERRPGPAPVVCRAVGGWHRSGHHRQPDLRAPLPPNLVISDWWLEVWNMKLSKIALSLLLAVLVSMMALWPSWAADNNQQKLDQVKQQIEQEKAQLAQKEQQKQLVTQQLQQADQSIVQTRDDLDNLNGQLTLLQTRITNDQQDLQTTQASLDDRTRIFDQRLRDIYIDGNVSYLDVLFNATNLNDFLTRFDLLQRIAEQDISLMQQITAMHNQIAQNEKDMEDQQAQTVVLRNQALAKQVALTASSQQKKQLMHQIQAQMGDLNTDLDEDEAYAQQLTQIIQGLTNKNAPPQGTGHFIWPVKGPITSPFGPRINPYTHQHSFHTGIDIGVPYGTPIHAADGGTVIFAGWNVAYGNMTVIDHGGGFSTMYAHQSKQIVGVGDHVTQGQIIGYIGTTGWSTGPHLHFEIRMNGTPVNPMKYLP